MPHPRNAHKPLDLIKKLGKAMMSEPDKDVCIYTCVCLNSCKPNYN